MSGSKIFSILSFSFIFGIFCRSFFEILPIIYFLLFIVTFILAAVLYKNKKILFGFAVVSSFSFGVLSLDRILFIRSDVSLGGTEFSGESKIISPIERKQNYYQFVIDVPGSPSGAIVNTSGNQELSYGDVIDISCRLEVPENKDEKFDYKMYLKKDGIGYLCKNAKIIDIKTESSSGIKLLIKIRNYFSDAIARVIPQPEGALAAGLIFGGGDNLSENLKNDFSKTGMTHIIAVSGYNVTIVAQYLIIIGIALGLWRIQATWFAIIGILFFVVMVGMPASAVRAGFMSSILLWAMNQGRIAKSYNAILFAALLMLLMNPMLLRWDIGFQLSFMAAIGVIVFSDLWWRSSFSDFESFGFGEMIVLTIGAQLFVFPIIAYNFQTFSVISLLANMAILPIIPMSMLLVLLVALSSFLPFLSAVFAWLAYVPLKYEVFMVSYLADFSWSSVTIKEMKGWFIILYYLILFLLIKFLNYRQNQIKE